MRIFQAGSERAERKDIIETIAIRYFETIVRVDVNIAESAMPRSSRRPNFSMKSARDRNRVPVNVSLLTHAAAIHHAAASTLSDFERFVIYIPRYLSFEISEPVAFARPRSPAFSFLRIRARKLRSADSARDHPRIIVLSSSTSW